MKITNIADKAVLDQALVDPRTTLLLVNGDNPKVSAIHAKAETIDLDPDWKIFWVADVSILSSNEKAQLCGTDSQYVTLSSMNESGERERMVKSVDSLCLVTSGKPSVMSIKKAFTDARL